MNKIGHILIDVDKNGDPLYEIQTLYVSILLQMFHKEKRNSLLWTKFDVEEAVEDSQY